MRGEVVIRNEGVTPEERYAPDDPTWTVPAGSLPEGLEVEEPLGFDQAISDVDELADDSY